MPTAGLHTTTCDHSHNTSLPRSTSSPQVSTFKTTVRRRPTDPTESRPPSLAPLTLFEALASLAPGFRSSQTTPSHQRLHAPPVHLWQQPLSQSALLEQQPGPRCGARRRCCLQAGPQLTPLRCCCCCRLRQKAHGTRCCWQGCCSATCGGCQHARRHAGAAPRCGAPGRQRMRRHGWRRCAGQRQCCSASRRSAPLGGHPRGPQAAA